MCKPTTAKRQPLRLLLSLDSFETTKAKTEDDSNAYTPPSYASCALTGVVVLAVLTAVEFAMYTLFTRLSHLHPLLEETYNRQILARHVGVDALSCLVVSFLGWQCFYVNKNVLKAGMSFFGKSNDTSSSSVVSTDDHAQRLFTYHPGGFRISLFFFWYQVKNLYDTLVWNDGPEFIFHHVFSLVTAWGAMNPGCGHYYCIFFFGMCEVSTGILCLLSNFDDDHGVPGLGAAMPELKLALGGVFIVMFIVCRCILWPLYSYYFGRDVVLALKGSDARTDERRLWMKFFLVSLSGLSVLQIAWLGQILAVAKEEVAKSGLF